MRMADLLDQINKNKRKKLVKFLKERNYSDTRLELIGGDLYGNGRKDFGTLTIAICSHNIYDESGETWDFFILTDTMGTKELEEKFFKVRMNPEVVKAMLPPNLQSQDHGGIHDAKEMGALQARVEILQQERDSLKDAFQQVEGFWKDSSKEASELSLWKSAHSGNYRHAGRKRKFSSVNQGESIYKMHVNEKVSFRKIAEIMNMSYSSARRLYQEYVEYQKKYGTLQ